ncbi:hypothetical protein [Fluviispira vulneris]|uniref:hypothetical protein n=1 Tax=Fluviispira vulneris TaxID=2763012 RepID=UPI001646DFDD|nr:hypothetical protein [Fluviispira vulneris]
MAKQGNLKKNINSKKMRGTDELDLLKIILDENKELKKKVMRFIQKSLGKTTSGTAKVGKKGAKPI